MKKKKIRLKYKKERVLLSDILPMKCHLYLLTDISIDLL